MIENEFDNAFFVYADAVMNFQPLRSVREATRHGYNLTEVADTLHTSQPGVSRQEKGTRF